MSRKTAMKILQAAEKTDPKGFKLEDVLFTGIVRTKAGLAAPDEAPKVKDLVWLRMNTF